MRYLIFVLCLCCTAAQADVLAYVACPGTPQIEVFAMDVRTGALVSVQKLDTPGVALPLAVAPDKRHLYAAIGSQPTLIDVLAIDGKTGRLTDQETQPFVAGMNDLSFDRTGHVLLSASAAGKLISLSRVDAKGSVDPQPAQVLDTGAAGAIAVDPTGKYVLATMGGDNVIRQYRFDATAVKLAPNAPPSVVATPGAGPRGLLFTPDRKIVYVANATGGTVEVFGIDAASGALSQEQEIRAAADGQPGPAAIGDLRLTPDGKFLYVADKAANALVSFRVDRSSGKLAPLARTPTEAGPNGFAIEPRGRYLVAAGQNSNALTVYAIDRQTGSLKAVQHADTGKNPSTVLLLELP